MPRDDKASRRSNSVHMESFFLGPYTPDLKCMELKMTSNSTSSSCEFWPNKPWQCSTVTVLLYLFATFALICCILVIVAIVVCKMYKLYTQRFILFLSVAATLKTINYFLMERKEDADCWVQGFLMQFFSWSELLWVVIITVNIVLVLKQKNPVHYEKIFHTFVWGTALLLAIIPLLFNSYGIAGFWCWIDRDHSALRFVTWYIPLTLIMCTLLVVYILLLRNAYRMSSTMPEASIFEETQSREMFQREIKPLLAYPIIFLIFNLPTIILRIDDAVYPESPPRFDLTLAAVIFAPLIGAFNALAFAFYNDTFTVFSLQHIRDIFRKPTVNVMHNYQVLDVADSDLEDTTVKDLTMSYGTTIVQVK